MSVHLFLPFPLSYNTHRVKLLSVVSYPKPLVHFLMTQNVGVISNIEACLKFQNIREFHHYNN